MPASRRIDTADATVELAMGSTPDGIRSTVAV